MIIPLINCTSWLLGENSPINYISFFMKSISFIIKVETESYSVNWYNCHLRGEIKVLVAIETDSGNHLFL